MKAIKYIFTLVGIGMLTGAFLLYNSTNSFLKEAVTAEGTVVELVRSRSSDSTTYAPVIHFIDGTGETVEFTSSTSSNPPSYSEGEKVEVLYLPSRPQEAKINSFFSLWGAVVIVGGLGGVFFLIGAAIILIPMLQGRRDEYLKQQGTRIETEFQSVELNRSLSVNGRNPFRVLTQWQNPATSEVHVFASNNLWFDPTSYIKSKKITVFIETNNPKKYYVDLSFLPRQA
jgi:hypothetical protein